MLQQHSAEERRSVLRNFVFYLINIEECSMKEFTIFDSDLVIKENYYEELNIFNLETFGWILRTKLLVDTRIARQNNRPRFKYYFVCLNNEKCTASLKYWMSFPFDDAQLVFDKLTKELWVSESVTRFSPLKGDTHVLYKFNVDSNNTNHLENVIRPIILPTREPWRHYSPIAVNKEMLFALSSYNGDIIKCCHKKNWR